MKTRRIASSLALAAAIALGATGCGLMAPQATLDPYAPSDGIDLTVGEVDIRNLMLIADESGDNFNVVFTGVNQGQEDAVVRMTFVSDEASAEASADFVIASGLTVFGNPESEIAPTLVSLPEVSAGVNVEGFFEFGGGGEKSRLVPVLDGTLAEYRDYVLSASQVRGFDGSDSEDAEESEIAADEDAADSDAAESADAADEDVADSGETEGE